MITYLAVVTCVAYLLFSFTVSALTQKAVDLIIKKHGFDSALVPIAFCVSILIHLALFITPIVLTD